MHDSFIQSLVEYMHKDRRMTEDSLAESVKKAWNYIDSAKKFPLVVDRWKHVLGLILLGKGDNHLVESCRGLRSSLVEDTIQILVDFGSGGNNDDVDELEDLIVGLNDINDDNEGRNSDDDFGVKV